MVWNPKSDHLHTAIVSYRFHTTVKESTDYKTKLVRNLGFYALISKKKSLTNV